MNYTLAERTGLKYLIIENTYPNECWALRKSRYLWWFGEMRPEFADLDGMRVKSITHDEAMNILKKYADDSIFGHKVKELINRLNVLPF